MFEDDLETLLATENFSNVYVIGWTDYLGSEEEPRTARERAEEARKIENRKLEFYLVFAAGPLEETLL